MRRMNKPAERARDVFELCIGSKITGGIQEKLRLLVPAIVAAEIAYEEAASREQLYTFQTRPCVSATEARAVYTQRFQPEGSAGREVYNRLLLSAPGRQCPLCGAGFVDSLDHYLPKSPFWELAVLPANLVPSCDHCNTSKHTALAKSEAEQTIHPYFDDFDDEIWLAALLVEIKPVAVTYRVVEPVAWSTTKRSRAASHFEKLELAEIYIYRAGNELSELKDMFRDIHERSGAAGVRERLEEDLYYAQKLPHKNDWKTALYRELAASRWFWEEGCLAIGWSDK